MTPLKIGAALMTHAIADHRDWLFADNRDLEIQDLADPALYANGLQDVTARAKAAIDGFEGRVGIHGPFRGLDIACLDPDVAAVMSGRFVAAIEAAATLGAGYMVIHSPFDNWHEFNRHMDPGLVPRTIDSVQALLGPALRLGETHGVQMVVENIKDITPEIRRTMVEAIASPALALSIDTGHAAIAGRASGAPPVDVYVRDAGNLLRHVHIQDGDGYADRHRAPGDGALNWHEIFLALSELTSAPHLVLELRRHNEVPKGFAHLKSLGLAC